MCGDKVGEHRIRALLMSCYESDQNWVCPEDISLQYFLHVLSLVLPQVPKGLYTAKAKWDLLHIIQFILPLQKVSRYKGVNVVAKGGQYSCCQN